MVARLVDVMGTVDARIVVPMVVVLLVGFLGWVILNEGRTHRLERLIRAFRGPDKGDGDDV
ncbi:hypothetical protein ACFWDZ_25880 [Micromonospora aurantiaca]|uniref:Uncharacterized protein n=1 Tax=Micromonospora aurantiaca (nom. illeg.) TaxID=47850 RepID=A0A6N3K767_9ACTN|nr:hypothetical protein [Micromonospora aurantiaca]AXH93550.1 hypothetical protein DVH21_28515 [Micromonospora aurantiaca]